MKKDYLGIFRSRFYILTPAYWLRKSKNYRKLEDLVEKGVIGAWNWTEKTVIIFAVVGAVFFYQDIQAFLNKPAEAKETITTEIKGDRRADFMAVFDKQVEERKQDASFKAKADVIRFKAEWEIENMAIEDVTSNMQISYDQWVAQKNNKSY